MSVIKEKATISAEAIFDYSRKYRFTLKRIWDSNKPKVVYILLNPSKADHLISDLTFLFCMNYAIEKGFGQLEIVNLFAVRVTDSDELKKIKEPIGDENDQFIVNALKDADLIIAGWGSKGSHLKRDKKVINLLKDYKGRIKCFTDSRNLQLPRHPSRLKNDYRLIDYY